MTRLFPCRLSGLLLGALSACSSIGLAQDGGQASGDEFFEKQVRPILVRRCYSCHSSQSEEIRGGLRVDSRAALLTGGETGPAIVPGQPDESLLIDAVRYGEIYQMPPKTRLPAEEVAALEQWVAAGAVWPGADAATPAPSREAFDWRARKAEHWAWSAPLVQPPQPRDPHAWATTPIDRYVLEKLEQQQLTPAPPAEPRVLYRRLHFDLTGLPPGADDLEQFVASKDPRAYERAVERLLASPAFGEHWARRWLDLVRYAESRGHEFDYDTPNAFEYRDYVIRAFNRDVPYDQLVREHVAGDLLPEPRRHPEQGFNESILGTGFWHLGEWVHSPVDIRKDETDRFDNMLDVFSKTFLGLTIACARCHDHKFDAISQRDYYALAGYLQSSAYRQARFESLDHNRRIAEQWEQLREHAAQRLASLHPAAQPANWARTAEYLLAARELLARGAADDAASDALAAQRELDPQRLRWWREALRQPADDSVWSFFHAAAATVASPTPAADAPQWGDAEVLFDYTRPGSAPQWLADGWAFGTRPQTSGDLVLADPDQPRLGVAVWGAIRRDPAWPKMERAAGVQNDAGRLAGLERAGQTVRTPTFTITQPRLHYLVRGQGVAYLVVDSHRMVNGPLHGGLVRPWEAKGEQPQWVTHEAADYVGHGAHLEFIAVDREPLEVFAVAAGPAPPRNTLPTPGQSVAAAITAESASPEAWARAGEDLVLQASRWLQGEREGNPPQPAVLAMAQWLLKAQPPADPERRDEAEELLRQFADQARELLAGIKSHSRQAPAMWDGSGEDERILVRGNPLTVGEPAPRGLPLALCETPPSIAAGSGRLQLAEQLLEDGNPLTARVMANRIWAHLMGRGVVATPDNFGVLGKEPTHPELLDYLAVEFRRDWSIKRLIREIVLSQTYRQSSQASEAARQRDPDNLYWSRHSLKRLTAEAIRDSLLVLSGRRDSAMYGPSVPVYLTPFMQGRGRPASGPVDGQGRRSVYCSIRRNFLSPMMLAFDMPQPTATIGQRTTSNVPAQALILLNDPLVLQQCDLWAERLLAATPRSDVAGRVDWLYRSAFGRPPTAAEAAASRAFLEQRLPAPGAAEGPKVRQAWAEFCHVLVNVKEFIFLR